METNASEKNVVQSSSSGAKRSLFSKAQENIKFKASTKLEYDSPFTYFRLKKKICYSPEHEQTKDSSSSSPALKRTPFVSLPINQILPKKSSVCCDKPNIDLAVQKSMQNCNLIGDFSQNCQLPTIRGSHPDLNCISPEIMVSVLNGKFMMKSYFIFDCRYPYEYSGGHIQNAQNFYLKEDIVDFLFKNNSQEEKKVLFFYCEFSSKRGPDMARFIRNQDREINRDLYPFLYYPEMYIIEGGYQLFFEKFKEYCVPSNYVRMLDENCTNEFQNFREKCRSRKAVARCPSLRLGLKF